MKYRSKFEESIGKQISGHHTQYEPIKVPYTIPETNHLYHPDWVFTLTSDHETIWIEAKGKLSIEDQKKMKLIRQQYPTQRIVFVFQSPNNKIRKGAQLTYKDWAIKNGFEVLTVKELVEWTKQYD